MPNSYTIQVVVQSLLFIVVTEFFYLYVKKEKILGPETTAKVLVLSGSRDENKMTRVVSNVKYQVLLKRSRWVVQT